MSDETIKDAARIRKITQAFVDEESGKELEQKAKELRERADAELSVARRIDAIYKNDWLPKIENAARQGASSLDIEVASFMTPRKGFTFEEEEIVSQGIDLLQKKGFGATSNRGTARMDDAGSEVEYYHIKVSW